MILLFQCASVFLRAAPKNEDEMMIAIFECVDRMFSIVRPRKLLYMAIDGVVRIMSSDPSSIAFIYGMCFPGTTC